MDHTALHASVCEMLIRETGSGVSLGDAQELHSQFTVLRIPIIKGDGLPESIIVKQIPSDARFGADKRFRSEWGGLLFANTIATDTAFAPKVIAGDLSQRIIVLEDLGDARDLNAHLHDANVDGTALLIEYGTFLGTMHAASIGRESEFLAIQQDLDAHAPASDSNVDLRERLDALRGAFAPNPMMSEQFIDEILVFSAAIHDDNSFNAFTHCDAGPHNVLVTENGLRFVDFEFSTYCHPLMDMTAVYLAFPPFWNGHPIPKAALKHYENAYRQAMAEAVPDIMGDTHFNSLLEQCCAKWILGKFINMAEKTYPELVHNEVDDAEHVAELSKWRKFCMKLISAYLIQFADKAQLKAIYAVMQSFYEDVLAHNDDLEVVQQYEAF